MKLVYKLISALLAIAVLPVMFFLPFLDLNVTSSLFKEGIAFNGSLQSLLSGDLTLATGNEAVDKLLGNMDYKALWTALGELRTPLIISVVSLVLALLLALVAAVVSLAAKKKSTLAVLGGAGLLATIAGLVSFGFVSGPVLDGSFDVLSLMGPNMDSMKGLANALSALTGDLLSVKTFRLDTAVTVMFMLFLGLLMWSVCWYIAEIMLDGGKLERKKKVLTPAQRAAKKAKEMKKQQEK